MLKACEEMGGSINPKLKQETEYPQPKGQDDSSVK